MEREIWAEGSTDVLTQIGDHMSISPYFVEEMMGYPIGGQN